MISEARRLLTLAFRSAYQQRHPNRLQSYVVVIGGTAALCALLWVLGQLTGLEAPASPYLLLILAVSLRWGLRLGLLTSLLSVVAERVDALPGWVMSQDAVPDVVASLVLYGTVAVAVGLLASFYRGERLRAELAAEQERKAAEYQRSMVAVLAHDLKAPLTAARGYLELARRQERQGHGDRADAAMAISLDQLDRLTAMIVNLVEASRIEQAPLSLQSVPVLPLVRRCVTASNSDPTHPVEVFTGEEELCVQADAAALGRILDNLLSNAVKYSPEGGPVGVGVRSVQAGGSRLVEISVADRGVGVPEEEHDKIFAPYYRGRNQRIAAGTGVGLYVCRELSHRMGGALSYEARAGGGSIFRLRLPAVEPCPVEGGSVAPARQAAEEPAMAGVATVR